MKVTPVSSTAYVQKTQTEISREVRQTTQAKGFQETIEKAHQADRRHEEGARIAHAAFKDSLENSSPIRKEDGVDKMVREVARQKAEETRQQHEDVRRQTDVDQSNAAREKVNEAYGESTQSSQPENERPESTPEQSPRQQQSGADSYRDATKNSVDRTVELVI
ncbi:MAG: hypothetical protein OEZ33_11235 [Gammaproteobacteria bacterium]|nr:hypothetical protein [Gammaproteobacteria bacterium]MDH5778777.1 hypothetical protein [Gammaproteobacteria bacterium]